MRYDFSSIFSLRDTLQSVIRDTVTGDLDAPEKFRFAVSQQWFLSGAQQEDDRFRILEGADAITEYARWYILSGEFEGISTLDEFIHDIESCYTKAETPIITADTVTKIRAFLDQEFNFTEKVLSKYPISVSIIDAAHKTCNGFVTAAWTSERSEGATFLFRIGNNSERKTPATVLLHELGHHIHLCAAGNEFEVPEDFKDLFSFMNVDASKLKDGEIREFFADALIVAATAKTKEFGDPFPNLPQSVRDLCFRYMKRVIANI